jgi:dTDP-4-dehydrorhamnose reductase
VFIMHVLVFGSNGMLGHALTTVLGKRYQVTGLDLPETDITRPIDVWEAITSYKPDIVVNSAAYTDVDGCETNVELAFSVNSRGNRNLAQVCAEGDIPLLYISTDYVFEGTSITPYRELDWTNPRSEYGKSKLQGEQHVRELCSKHYIIRTSWLYGPEGKNFVNTMLGLAKEREEIGVVNDQIGTPTYTMDLAEAVSVIIGEQNYGIYHITNSGSCTWYEFALEIFRQAGIKGIEVKPITTEEINRLAPRPKNSVLDNLYWKLQGKDPLRPYQEALRAYLTAE